MLSLAKLRKLNRASFDVQLAYERAAVDRMWASAQRVQESQQRRADRLIAKVGIDDDDRMFDAATRERLRTLRRTDPTAWAVAFGEARIAAVERKQAG